MVSTIAGGLPGDVDGECSKALFHHPYGITLDNDGNIIVADFSNHSLKKISLI